jgi:putative transposase
MVSPAVRRQQVKWGRHTGLSQRRACRLLRVSRSMLNYPSRQELKDQWLWEQIRPLAQRYPRYGYRRIWALLRRAGERINHKRAHRLWKLQALSLSRKRKLPRRGPPSPRPLAPKGPNEV